MKPLLNISELTVKYDEKVVLNKLDLQVFEGEILVVLGASGDGKTTLLKAVAGLLPVTEGSITYQNKKLKDSTEQLIPGHDAIQLVNQDFGLDLYHNVEENLRLKLLAYDEDYRAERVGELLDLIELKELKSQKAVDLSGGQKQRLAIARALADEPEVILLDEPFNQLDYQMKSTISDHIREYLKENNITAILVTHNGIEAMDWADRIAYLKEGVIRRVDSPENFYQHPGSIEEGRFFGDLNIVDLNGEKLVFRPGSFDLQPSNEFQTEINVRFIRQKKLGWYTAYVFALEDQEIKLFSKDDISSHSKFFINSLKLND